VESAEPCVASAVGAPDSRNSTLQRMPGGATTLT